jgi:hypothetical protein
MSLGSAVYNALHGSNSDYKNNKLLFAYYDFVFMSFTKLPNYLASSPPILFRKLTICFSSGF